MHDVVYDVLVVNLVARREHSVVDSIELLGRRFLEGELLHESSQSRSEIRECALEFCGVNSKIVIESHFNRRRLQKQKDQYRLVTLLRPSIEDDIPNLDGILGKKYVLVGPPSLYIVGEVQGLVDINQKFLGNGPQNLHCGKSKLRLGIHGDELQYGQDFLV